MLVLFVCASPAVSVVIEVPLPGLNGTYVDSRTVPLVLPAVPTVIHGASFRVTGTAQVGSMICRVNGQGTPGVWSAEVFIAAHDGTYIKYWALDEAVSTSGPFTLQDVAMPSYGTTDWAFLMDGVGAVTLHGGATYLLGICTGAPTPTVTVTEAVFIIDGEFPALIEPTTWGRIKALYR